MSLTQGRQVLGEQLAKFRPISIKATFKHLLNTPEYSKQAASWCMNAVSGMMEEPKTPPADTKKPSK
ncbi:hypothetical protein MRX96_019634 [Rhipicephalus microplus]